MLSSCCFDLETSSLDAGFGIILCAVIKGSNQKKPTVLRADELNPEWDTRRSDDSAIVMAIAEELDKYDVLVAHNGARFDIPYLRTRMARWKLGPFPNKKLVDPLQLARNKFRLGRNSLAALGSLINAPEKTPVDGQVWVKASLDGDRDAMKYICRHCVRDVEILELVLDAVKGYCGTINSWGSAN
ncbi:MAG: ribonuclease H-like domain-containing protein [Acidobacteria bacterium]|nr:ribonuclease H-like domain-containing protein [Acidobacteriota bacterium]